MDREEILHIIKQGENESIEFKTSFGKEVIESIVAFSNAKGGKVIIGVNDNKIIIGITISDESIQNWINQIKQNTDPQVISDVQTFKLNNKNIVVFDVMEYPIKPVSYRNKYFKRIANSNHIMRLDEITNEHLKTINSSWDFYPDPNHSLEDISLEKVNRLIDKIEKRTENKIALSPLEFLNKLEIIRKNQLTFGGYLLFAKDYCTISDVQVGRFKGQTTIIDSISLNNDLLTEADEIISFIKKNLMVEYIITGEPQRTERFDYPLDAIREIVINMIVHRDYRDSSASIIKIFDDRIEFFNPGILFGGITIEILLSGNYSSKTRNKLVAKVFKEIGLIERYGSGIMRIRRICKEYGIIDPKFEEVFNGFRVILFKEKLKVAEEDTENVTENVTDKVTDKVTDNQKKIIDHLKENNRTTTAELAQKVGISQRKVKENIRKLKEIGLLTRIGSEKNGHWQVMGKVK
ncbi:MAG: putative DNA binding domain-containing protein [Bacteroidia bacterium]|nr:putative DNA binding domain-containing protein [Bacteroidia bacterium]